jgi:hypothetical protein
LKRAHHLTVSVVESFSLKLVTERIARAANTAPALAEARRSGARHDTDRFSLQRSGDGEVAAM